MISRELDRYETIQGSLVDHLLKTITTVKQTKNSPYLKYLCVDGLSFLGHHGVEYRPDLIREYMFDQLREQYIDRIIDYYHPHVSSDRLSLQRSFESISSFQIQHCVIQSHHISLLSSMVRRCRDMEKSMDGAHLRLGLTYICSYYPPQLWLYTKMCQDLYPVVEILYAPLKRISSIMHTVSFSVCNRLLVLIDRIAQQPITASDKYCLFGHIVFVMTLLHIFHISALCDQFKEAVGGEDFMRTSQKLNTFTKSLIEWKCR